MVRTERLQAGDLVRVRSEVEILATLDPDGTLDGLPFMPEMKTWCGGQFRVSRRSDKTCDTVEFRGQRRMHDTVHLAELRCDGSAHGGCQAGCLTFWKEAWLVLVPEDAQRPPNSRVRHAVEPVPIPTPVVRPRRPGCTPAQLAATTQGPGAVYSCQATRLLTASEPLPWFDPRQYIREVRTGNVGLLAALLQTAIYLFNNLQNLQRRFLPQRMRLKGGSWYPFVSGRLTKTPRETLDLAPGELVEVKSKDEILATLDRGARNRGMTFDVEMAPFCGQSMRVLRRVERIIDERTGKMLTLGTDAVILDGAVCAGRFHGMCPRQVYPFWREIWLRRVGPSSVHEEARAASRPCQAAVSPGAEEVPR
jgi:hypothetical protein